jgi:hypothetical protein
VDSGGEEDTAAQKIEAGAPGHLRLDHLELVDLPLRLSAAPRHGKRRFDRRPILLQAGREGLDGRNTAGPGLLKPSSENSARVGRSFVAVDTAVSHQIGEASDQGEDTANFGILSNPGKRRGRGRIESFRRLNQQPGELSWRERGGGRTVNRVRCGFRWIGAPLVRRGFAGAVRRSPSQRRTCLADPAKPSSLRSRHSTDAFSHPSASRASR